MDFFDEIDRPVLGFLVDAEDIFSDYSQENELDGAQKIEAQQGGGPSDEGKAHDFIHNHIDAGTHENDA